MCPAPVSPHPVADDLTEQLARAEDLYRKARQTEQLYLAICRYTDLLQRYSRELLRRKRAEPPPH